MVEVEALRMQHWLMWKPGGSNEVVGCHCGFAADVEADSGYGDSVVVHFFEVAAAAVRAEAVADERRRIDAEIRQSFPPSPRYMPRDTYNGMRDAFRVALDIVAAGSVPVATPLAPADRWGLTHNGHEYGPFDTKQAALAYGGTLAAAEIGPMHEWNAFPLIAPVATPGNAYCDNGLHSIRAGETCQSDPCRVATPPAEPPAHLGGVRADNAVLDIPAQRRAPERAPITPRAPSQPVTCEHGKTDPHWFDSFDPQFGQYPRTCPGPVV